MHINPNAISSIQKAEISKIPTPERASEEIEVSLTVEIKKEDATNTNLLSIKHPPAEQPIFEDFNKKRIDKPSHFETDYISVKWIPEKHRIDVEWKQFVEEDKVKEVLLKEVAILRHTKIKCLFLDARKFKGTNPNIPKWANEVWSQMAYDAGLRHFVTIVSDKDIFAMFSLKNGMGEKLMSLVDCAVFKTPVEAEIWMRKHTHPEKPELSEEELAKLEEEYQKKDKENGINASSETAS